MIYLYLVPALIFLLVLAIYFLRSISGSRIPPNAQLLVDAWNGVTKAKKKIQRK